MRYLTASQVSLLLLCSLRATEARLAYEKRQGGVNSAAPSKTGGSNASATSKVSVIASSTIDGTSASPSASTSGNTTIGAGPTAAKKTKFPDDGMQLNGIHMGFLPDNNVTMSQTNQKTGLKASAYGWYAQTKPGTPWDGSQMLERLDDIKACNCVLEASVMPEGGFDGYSSPTDYQPTAIAKYIKQISDEGVEIRLRFGHEMNWYLSDGSSQYNDHLYEGDAAGYKTAWTSVAKAVRQAAPNVKMYWCPNWAPQDTIDSFWPDDPDAIPDVVGWDMYPKPEEVKPGFVVGAVKDFYTKYVKDGREFSIGEAGIKGNTTMDVKLAYLKDILSAETKQALPDLTNVMWFDYNKGDDDRITTTNADAKQVAALFSGGGAASSNSTSASGAASPSGSASGGAFSHSGAPLHSATGTGGEAKASQSAIVDRFSRELD